jgi:hypothetical protein
LCWRVRADDGRSHRAAEMDGHVLTVAIGLARGLLVTSPR